MSYMNKGQKPFEYASKDAHSHIINDSDVQEYLNKCSLPKESNEVQIRSNLIFEMESVKNPISLIIAIDGGRSTVPVKKTFPSSTLTFFQFGALSFNISDLESLSFKPFISPEDIARLKELERIKFVLPTKNISLSGLTLSKSVRKSLYDFFLIEREGKYSFMETLFWFIFQEFNQPQESYQLASCPICKESRIKLSKKNIGKDFKTFCNICHGEIFLTDVFRLHEAIDDELGAEGVIGYLTNLLEQIILIHTIRIILILQPSLLQKILFIKDGPLAFFGQTANMHEPMRNLCNFLFEKHNLFLAGLEKSGVFVEHADAIKDIIRPGHYLLLDNQYIYKNILPGDPNTPDPYAHTSYYSTKLIYKSRFEEMYVVSIPTENADVVMKPDKNDFRNLDIILENIEKLRCDMYENSLLPVALANKLVSLSNHHSSTILEKFAKQSIIDK